MGCGNPVRRDDALGLLLAREASWWGIPGLRVLTVPGWLPELASDLAAADRVVLLDAEDRCGTPRWLPPGREPGRGAGWHRPSPEALLALVRELSGAMPEVRILSLPGRDFGFGDEISPTGRRTLEVARGMLRRALDLTAGSAPEASEE